MKKQLFLILLLLLLTLWGCSADPVTHTAFPVNIRETGGFTVEDNGQMAEPGRDVTFLLEMEEGWTLASTDYQGDYRIALENGKVALTLRDVRRPVHVGVTLTDTFTTITYEPNGGLGAPFTGIYDTANHLRTNTDTGVDLFTRPGYTLVSWNTRPDGSGEEIGLGSRTDRVAGLTLYAQWAKWSDEAKFDWEIREDSVTVTGYHGSGDTLAIPGELGGLPVTAIASGAIRDCTAERVILPPTLVTLEDGAFQNCALRTLTLFDNLEVFGDGSFLDCPNLQTLAINAVEQPYGYNYRKEGVYADKVDLLMTAQGRKIVFYGGCSMWFNLDSTQLQPLVDQGYAVVNMGLNGMANSAVQMQILGHFLGEGDIFFHTPEISSAQQMLMEYDMAQKNSDKLWCGLEYNYDLVKLIDLRQISGILDSFRYYLDLKLSGTTYTEAYEEDGRSFWGEYGCIPFFRDTTYADLPDEVHMDPSYITDTGLARLKEFYDQYQAQGARIYVSYACFNMDAVVEEERPLVEMVDDRYRRAFRAMDGPTVISTVEDFLYTREDFYDTNYHLRSEPARLNTQIWLRDLQAQMEADGLWEAP